ncbi:MAG: autoinducer binding domain-containing protein [Alphaproteobacteria bacterium]
MQTREQLREQIFATDSMDAALGVLTRAAGEIGVHRLVAGFVRGAAQGVDGRWRVYRHRSFNFPPGWDEAWHLYNAQCPYYHACFDGRVAFDWDSVRRRTDLSPLETKAWRYLADFGLVEGFTVPVHTPGHFGFVTVVGEKSDRGWARRIEQHSERLLFLTHVFHEAAREHFPQFVEVSDDAPLSMRERECLRWAAAGKTTEEVALILGLSHETVRVYFKRAMRKMGATTRAQAVARACEMQLLS